MTSSWLSESNAGLMSRDTLLPLLRPELLPADSFLCCLSSECDVSSGIFLANDPSCPNFRSKLYEIHQSQTCVLNIFGFSETTCWHYCRTRLAIRFVLNYDLKWCLFSFINSFEWRNKFIRRPRVYECPRLPKSTHEGRVLVQSHYINKTVITREDPATTSYAHI